MNIQLRPYQEKCKRAIKENYDKGIREQLIVEATGLGKRLQSVELMRHFNRSLFIAHREELIGQAYDEIEKFWPMEVGIIKGQTFEIDKRIVVASVQTLQNRLDRIKPDMFDYIVVDECFPAGTKVDNKNIEEYKVGDIVSSFNHLTGDIERQHVLRTFKKPSPSKLYDFGYFRCTSNHPIFIIGIGYCIAKEIYYAYLCYKVMCYVSKPLSYLHKLWERICNKNRTTHLFEGMRIKKKRTYEEEFTKNDLLELWQKIRIRRVPWKSNSIHGFSAKRWWLLFWKMQKGIFQQDCINNTEQDKQNVLFRTNEEKESDVQEGKRRENAPIFKRKNFLIAWRKRTTHETANYIVGIDQIRNGISNSSSQSNVTGKITSALLQSRFSSSKIKTRNRSGWSDSQAKALEVLRQKEDGSIEIIGLDNIKILKRRDRSKSSESSKENYVYNLEVGEHNNYFANSILVHNCHNYLSPSYLRTIRHFRPKLRTAWTATPKRLDGLSLTNIAKELVFQYRIEDGIKDGWLSMIEAYQIRTSSDLSGIKRVAGDFNQGQLSERVDSRSRNALIATKYLHYAKGRQAIAYCVDVKHSYNLRDILREHGVNAETIVGDPQLCPNRKELINKFKRGEIEVLTNCEVLTEGFDYHDIGCVMMARPTQSERLYIQAIGRGTRIKSDEFVAKFGSSSCIILDFVDNTGKLSLVNAYELERNMPIEERMFLPREHKEKLLAEREERERRIKIQQGADRKINLLTLPEVHMWESEKGLHPATEKQLEWLKSIGVWQEDVEYTKAMASELITNSPAKEWQIRWLAERKYDVSKGCTVGQYQRVKYIYDMKNKYAMDDKEKNKILNKFNENESK